MLIFLISCNNDEVKYEINPNVEVSIPDSIKTENWKDTLIFYTNFIAHDTICELTDSSKRTYAKLVSQFYSDPTLNEDIFSRNVILNLLKFNIVNVEDKRDALKHINYGLQISPNISLIDKSRLLVYMALLNYYKSNLPNTAYYLSELLSKLKVKEENNLAKYVIDYIEYLSHVDLETAGDSLVQSIVKASSPFVYSRLGQHELILDQASKIISGDKNFNEDQIINTRNSCGSN